MSVKFYLRSKNSENSSLNVIICHKGLRLKFSSGIIVNVKYWNQDRQRCKEVINYPDAIFINQAISKIEEIYKDTLNYFVSMLIIPTKKEFEEKVNEMHNGNSKNRSLENELFLPFIEKNIENLKKIREKATITSYKSCLEKVNKYEVENKIKLTFKDIDVVFYRDFQKWFYDQKYSVNYFGNIIKNIKVFMNEANEQGVTTCKGHMAKGFAKIFIEVDNIYLTIDELSAIYNLDLSKEFPKAKLKLYETARNKFLIGAFTALRVSDFNRLDDINVSDDFIRIKTKKTKTSVIVPPHWVVKEILANGFDLKKVISEHDINKCIRDICKAAKIEEDVLINESVSGANVQKVYKKWELVSTHTARRSGATNMFKAGIPSISIMKITGHKSEKAFLKYIKITNEENAELLSNHSFFKKMD
jgi:integrase